jgi:uncharacterized membrane protein YgaE (UPF0421/DUF939 family)
MPLTSARTNWRKFMPGVQLALRSAVAAGAAIAIARLFNLEYPIYAFLAALVVTDLSPSYSRQHGVRRLIATCVGAVCGAALSQVLMPTAWGIGLSILVAMLACQLLQMPDGAKVAGFICGIIVLEHSAETWLNAFHRLIETGLGIVVALLVSYVPKLIRIEEPNPPVHSDA